MSQAPFNGHHLLFGATKKIWVPGKGVNALQCSANFNHQAAGMRSGQLASCSLGRACPRSCAATPQHLNARLAGVRGLARLGYPLGRCKELNSSINFDRSSGGRELRVCGLGSDESSADVPLTERIQPGVIARVWYGKWDTTTEDVTG